MKQLWKFLTSLRLTAVLLALSIILVFIGTVAQADEGLYQAQSRYFKHWYVFGITFFGHHIPLPFPGGYLLGTALLTNLLAAHIQRFQWSVKKIGIHLTHAGVIILLVGQLTTDIFSYETQMRLYEGQTKNYSEASRDYELAFLSDAGGGMDEVVAIPASRLTLGEEIRYEKLLFTVRVQSFWNNSDLAFRAPMTENGPPATTNGIAKSFDFHLAADTKSMDSKNVPTALIEVRAANGSLGTWVVSGWAGETALVENIRDNYLMKGYPEAMASGIARRLAEAQTITVNGKPYTFALRPVRVYKPFSLTLLKATHETYPGRPDLPKDFRSRVKLENPATKENRELEVYMNSPLRYAGLTFYQYQMTAGEMVDRTLRVPSSVLQVVRNPSWLTPYAGCLIVAAGLITQFLIHLVGFMTKRMKT